MNPDQQPQPIPPTARIPARSQRQAMDWSLALASQGIEPVIELTADGHWTLVVAATDCATAVSTIRQYRLENLRWPWRQPIFKSRTVFDWASAGWVLMIVVIFWLTETRPGLKGSGILDSAAVAGGEWWRLFTAVWLHADLGHLASNGGFGLLLLGLVMGRYGTGVGLLASYLAGVGGNLASCLIYGDGHRSLGASGMVMGALGLVAVQSLGFLKRAPHAWRFPAGGVVAGVMLFVLLGLSPGTDVVAHFGGFVTGLALGALLVVSAEIAQNAIINFASALLFAVLVMWTWLLAFGATDKRPLSLPSPPLGAGERVSEGRVRGMRAGSCGIWSFVLPPPFAPFNLSAMSKPGTVYLVGAGPGDAGLLTLRGAELLRRADVVVYDVLVNPDLLRFAPATVELISRGRRTTDEALSQDALNALMIAKAREGKCVVRLKGGDPYIFGRGGEEAEALADAKIPFEVVPGVSSIAAAPNYAGIPLTHRGHCSSFTVLSGHEGAGKAEGHCDLDQIARLPGTKVILMGLKKLPELTEGLIARGVPADTPVAIVRWGTTGRQQSIEGALATIAALAAKNNFTPPAITIIGDVVKLRKKLNWFERRPLFGQRVVVTRARNQAPDLTSRLTELGAEVLEIPCIRIGPPSQLAAVGDALLELNSYDWLVFTSPNGVTAFFDLFYKAFKDTRDIGGVRIAAIGPGTAAKLRELHLQVDLMPEAAIGSKIAKAFDQYESIENLKICLLRAEAANPELPKALEELGAIVDDIACYKTVADTEDATGTAARLLERGADWITFTSASTVEHFQARFDLPALLNKFPQTKLASIGPETSKALTALGLEPTIEARQHTIDGLIAAVLQPRNKLPTNPG